jgi:hypothetical protein
MTHPKLAELFADQTRPDDERQEDSESDPDWGDETEPQKEEDAIQPDGIVKPLYGIQGDKMDGTAAESEEEPREEDEDDTFRTIVWQLWEAATNEPE